MRPFAITTGDPAGIGPEITLKLANQTDLPAPIVAVGDPALLQRTARHLEIDVEVESVAGPSDIRAGCPALHVISAGDPVPSELATGVVDALAGHAAYQYVTSAASLALAGEVAGLVTAPINKEALRKAGVPFAGHTEILAHLSGAQDYTMMMSSSDLRVALVTIHEPLRLAVDLVTRDSVIRVLRLTDRALRTDGARPRIAVAGLNPHAGENGLMGSEEAQEIGPAVFVAQAEGIDVVGPLPPDTVFMRARDGEFDVVVAQYHDQGLIPFKYLGIEHGVNITLGLPFIRTSVDHGTAFAIAGRGAADHTSLRRALHEAVELSGC